MSESQYDPGAALKAAREAIRVSAREVADELNLSAQVVEAIENNDTANLPAPVYTRGYIRAYAKLLELDPEPIVVGYDFPEPLPASVPDGRFVKVKPVFNKKQSIALVGAALVVMALLAWLVVWLWPNADAPVVVPVDVPVDIRVGEPPVEKTRVATQTNEPPSISVESEVGVQESEAPVIDDPIAEPLVIAEAQAQFTSPANGRRITEFGDDEMWFQFTKDCWVEIMDTEGADLYSDLSRAGQSLQLVGQGPFRILLGYAPGVQMEYNGEPVSLMAHTRNNVASLVLGQ